MKKDILLLCQYFYPEYNSSATLPFDTAKYLVQHGLSVDVICGYPKEYTKEVCVPLNETKNGIYIRRIRYLQLNRGKKICRLVNFLSFTFSACLKLAKMCKYRAILVYSNPPILPIVAVCANFLFKTKVVFVSYDVYPEIAIALKYVYPDGFIDKVMHRINTLMYKNASCIVALTEEMKDFLLKNRDLLINENVKIIPNWAHENETHMADAETRSQFGYDSDQFIVAYFGNMGIAQDMDTLLQTAVRLNSNKQIQFLLVGHGLKKDGVNRFIREKQLNNVRVLDFLTGPGFGQAMAMSSCCVVTLENGLKGLCAPSKYYSYLQAGKPVLAVVQEDSYLQKEIVDENIGKAVVVGDVDGLEKAILQLMGNPEETKKMGENARFLYKKEYAKEISLRKYLELFEQLLMENRE